MRGDFDIWRFAENFQKTWKYWNNRTTHVGLFRIVKWTKNPFVLFAKLRFSFQNHNLCFLRKLRFFIFRLNGLEFWQNDHREDAPHFSFGARGIFLIQFYPNMQLREKFWRFRSQFQVTNFSEKMLQYELYCIIIFAISAIHFAALSLLISIGCRMRWKRNHAMAVVTHDSSN